MLCASTYYIIGEYNHVEKDGAYYAGLITCFIVGAVIGAIAGYYFLYMYGIIANSIMLRLICYITLLIGGICSAELSRMAEETNNDLLASIFAYIGWLSILYGLLGIIDDGSTALSDNKRGAVGVSSSDGSNNGNPHIEENAQFDQWSTGRTTPNNLNEQLAMEEVQSNPLENATQVPVTMNDPRWSAEDDWSKWQRYFSFTDGTHVTIHFLYNSRTGEFADFKFV